MPTTRVSRPLSEPDILLRSAIVVLTWSTGYIHATLGGTLFTLNAIGFLVFAFGMAVPLPIAERFRWLVRIGLAGYAAATIAAWAMAPVHFSTAYVAKAIEVALIALLAIDFIRRDGNPVDRVRDALH
jgi:hypothetical protein